MQLRHGLAGAIIRVRSSIAVRMVLASDALPVFTDDPGAPPSGTLVAAIRAAMRNDAETARGIPAAANKSVEEIREFIGAVAGGA